MGLLPVGGHECSNSRNMDLLPIGSYMCSNPRKSVWLPTTSCAGSRMEGLPNELICMIASHLNEVDKLCLSLCSRTLNYCLRNYTSHSFDKREQEKFLLQLSCDLPQYLYCYACSTLHRSSEVGPPRREGPNRLIRCQGDQDPHRSFSPFPLTEFELTFHHIQAVMVRHRRGGEYGAALDTISWAEVRVSKIGKRLVSVEPSIISGELCLRIQDFRIMRPKALHPTIFACVHPKPIIKTHHIEPRKYQCKNCGGEYRIEVDRHFGPGRVAVHVTKWLNLGKGVSPNDTAWQRHLRTFVSTKEPKTCSPRQAFEQQTGKTLDDLTKENEALLRGNRFKKSFKPDWGPHREDLGELWIRYAYPNALWGLKLGKRGEEWSDSGKGKPISNGRRGASARASNR